ncbi:MAG: glutamate 5-kinase [Eubacteriales bacterium]|nr:glutamate 5-kinase [Eubacteriales bacterium]
MKQTEQTYVIDGQTYSHDRDQLKNKKRVIVKVGSSSLAHPGTDEIDLIKMEILVREIADLRKRGMDVVLVSSGAMLAGRRALGYRHRPKEMREKQASAAVGQARLIMMYQKLFSEYSETCAQILLTKPNILNPITRKNAQNTFDELLRMHVIPVVNENDTVAVSEFYQVPLLVENDTLAAVLATMIHADLVILLSDIDGLYTDDPKKSKDAEFIPTVRSEDEKYFKMGKGTSSNVGTGGMQTKLLAASIAVKSGIDLIIANGNDFHNVHRIINGRTIGTLFTAGADPNFDLARLLADESQQL